MRLHLLLLLALAACHMGHAHRIVGIFMHIGGSHFHTFYPILSELAERGHDVTVFSYFKVKSPPPNYHEIVLDGLPVISSSMSTTEFQSSLSYYSMIEQYFSLHWLGDQTCADVFKSTQLDELLRQHKENPFDLAITELFDTDCMLGIIHTMNIPYIGLSSCVLMPWHPDRVAMPDIPSHVPSEFVGFSERMTFEQRIKSWIVTKSVKLLYKFTQYNDDAYIRSKFGPGVPSVRELANQVKLVLVNQHFSYHGPRPLPPQVIEIGGVHIKKEKPIPKHLLDIIDQAQHGVILISWGSNLKMSTLPEHYIQAILNALKRLPQQFILKWENATLTNKPKNVHIQGWLPQRDILCHPNVKLFWTHGGNLGTCESVHCATPMLVSPNYGDQFVNFAALQNRGMATLLMVSDITESSVFEAIVEAMKPEYKQNADRTSLAFRERPMSPVATAVWWIEHVIKTDGFPLGRSYAIEMTWYAYHSVDVILLLIALASGILLVVCLAVRFCCCRRKVNTPKSRGTKTKKSN